MGLWDLQSFALCIYLHFTQHSRFFGIEVMQYFAMLPLDFRSAKGDFCKMHIFHKAFWMRSLWFSPLAGICSCIQRHAPSQTDGKTFGLVREVHVSTLCNTEVIIDLLKLSLEWGKILPHPAARPNISIPVCYCVVLDITTEGTNDGNVQIQNLLAVIPSTCIAPRLSVV